MNTHTQKKKNRSCRTLSIYFAVTLQPEIKFMKRAHVHRCALTCLWYFILYYIWYFFLFLFLFILYMILYYIWYMIFLVISRLNWQSFLNSSLFYDIEGPRCFSRLDLLYPKVLCFTRTLLKEWNAIRATAHAACTFLHSRTASFASPSNVQHFSRRDFSFFHFLP